MHDRRVDPLDLLELARARVDAVCDELHGIRRRAEALAHETAWQSRGAEAFRAAVASWVEGLDLLATELDGLRDEVAFVRVRGAVAGGSGVG